MKNEDPFEKEQEEIKKRIENLNNSNDIHGILEQFPLPKHLDSNKIISFIDPDKDIDVVRDERYKYLRIKDDEYIFDLKNDISEETNIIEQNGINFS